MLVKQSWKVLYLLSTKRRRQEAQNFHPRRQGARKRMGGAGGETARAGDSREATREKDQGGSQALKGIVEKNSSLVEVG